MNIPCNKYFEGKVVTITGAGGVLCGVLAEAYAKEGLEYLIYKEELSPIKFVLSNERKVEL